VSLEEIPLTNWFDSESDLPDILSTSLSSNLGLKYLGPRSE